jgi:hypothetical protein
MNKERCSGPCFKGLKDWEHTFLYCIDCSKNVHLLASRFLIIKGRDRRFVNLQQKGFQRLIEWLFWRLGVLRYCHIIEICKFISQAISQRFVRCQRARMLNCRAACLLEFHGLRMKALPPPPHPTYLTPASCNWSFTGAFPYTNAASTLNNLLKVVPNYSLMKCPLYCDHRFRLVMPEHTNSACRILRPHFAWLRCWRYWWQDLGGQTDDFETWSYFLPENAFSFCFAFQFASNVLWVTLH